MKFIQYMNIFRWNLLKYIFCFVRKLFSLHKYIFYIVIYIFFLQETVLFGIKFRFNPYEDLDGSKNTVETMVRLVNAIWNLIMQHKEITTNADKLKERNYSLQQNNFYLNVKFHS